MSARSIYKTAAGEATRRQIYDAALARWSVPYEARHVPTRHGRTFVVASGDRAAPPVVLLHGSCSNAVSWVADVAIWATRCRVYAVDLPGEPGRSSERRPPWRRDAWIAWLDDLLAGLDVASTALVGLSQGGWTALKYAARRPERIARLRRHVPHLEVRLRPDQGHVLTDQAARVAAFLAAAGRSGDGAVDAAV